MYQKGYPATNHHGLVSTKKFQGFLFRVLISNMNVPFSSLVPSCQCSIRKKSTPGTPLKIDVASKNHPSLKSGKSFEPNIHDLVFKM